MARVRELLLPWDSQPQLAIGADPSALERLSITEGAIYRPSRGAFQKSIFDSDLSYVGYAAFEPSESVSEVGLAQKLDGSAGATDYVRIPTVKSGASALNTRRFTLFARVRITASAGNLVCRAGTNNILLWRNGSNFDMRVGGTDYGAAGAWSVGQWYDIALVGGPSSCLLYVDGNLTINGGAAASASLDSNFNFGDDPSGGGQGHTIEWQYFLFSDVAHSAEVVRSIRDNPWQLFGDQTIWVPVSAGGGGISATLTQTLGNATVSAASTLALKGATNATLADATLASTATLAIEGTTTQTLADATLSATSVLGSVVTGTLTKTLDDATVAATGTLALAAVVTSTLADATLSATATVLIKGSATITLGDCTIVAVGLDPATVAPSFTVISRRRIGATPALNPGTRLGGATARSSSVRIGDKKP